MIKAQVLDGQYDYQPADSIFRDLTDTRVAPSSVEAELRLSALVERHLASVGHQWAKQHGYYEGDNPASGVHRQEYGFGHRPSAETVADGWALAYRRYSMDYVAAEAEARAARRGLWRGRFAKPWAWRAMKSQAKGSVVKGALVDPEPPPADQQNKGRTAFRPYRNHRLSWHEEVRWAPNHP